MLSPNDEHGVRQRKAGEPPGPDAEPRWGPGPPEDEAGGARDVLTIEPARARARERQRQPDSPVRKLPVEPPASPETEGVDRAPQRAFARRHPVLVALGAVILLLAAAGGYLYWDYASRFESTDDAFIAGRPFAIAPKVSGYITAVPVTDNQHVAAGDLIARIDDRDYRVALDQAQAQVAAAQASIRNIDAQIAVQQAQVQQAQASLTFAQQQASRYQDLARRGAGSVETAQQYSSTLRQQQAALEAAQRQIAALTAQRGSAEANLAQASAQRDQAKLNLSYTKVTAAQAGRVTNLTAAVGQYAAAGTSLSMFVPDDIWVTANFKETQLDAMRPGQPVTITIDAYPDRVLHGHVASVQSGSGTAFSLLPAENATGNYVKIVQRVPVKIVFDHPPGDVALGPGMSIVPTVRVDPSASLYERLRAWL